jgi:hypothetical protein
MAPAAKIGMLSQGQVVGVLADNRGQESNRKAFNALVEVDENDFNAEQKVKELPNFSIFAQDSLEQKISQNYKQIKADINELIDSELSRLQVAVKGQPENQQPIMADVISERLLHLRKHLGERLALN